jgi:hypothetical protein
MSKYLAKLKALREVSASPGNCQNCQNLGEPGFDSFDSTHGISLSRFESPFTEAREPNTPGCTHGYGRAPETLDLAQTGRDRPKERAAISEFVEGLPRAEAEAIARREMAGVYGDMQAKCNPGSYASALAALRANCPAYVPGDRWRRAIADATAFISKWGGQAQALSWTARELFGLHTPPERPLASYRRLARYDETGLVWLLRGRTVIALTETIAAIQGATAVLTYRKLNKPALGPLGDSVDDMGAAT